LSEHDSYASSWREYLLRYGSWVIPHPYSEGSRLFVIADYVGFVWERKVGRTADLTRRRGEDFDVPAFVAGVRFWF
ncbi:MAG: copper resistance protein B, partial [Pseudomonadota bacterium]|nr:copper resistance protein B [Pseudomonadota bacterium]